MIPRDVSSLFGQEMMFEYSDSSEPLMAQSIQEIISLQMIVNQVSYEIPLLGDPPRLPSDKLVTADGHKIWWPGYGLGDDMCSVDNCVKIELDLEPGDVANLLFQSHSRAHRILGGHQVEWIVEFKEANMESV